MIFTQSIHPSKLQYPGALFNGILIIADFAHDTNAQVPISQSHAGTLQMLMRKSGLDKVAGAPAYALASASFPPKGFYKAIPPAVLNFEFTQLYEIIDTLKPKAILGLGTLALKALKPDATDLDSERGAPFIARGVPCLVTYHPRDTYRVYERTILALHDFAKFNKLSQMNPPWAPEVWQIDYQPEFKDVVLKLMEFLKLKQPLSVDIETNSELKMTCIGLGYSRTQALVIPFAKPYGERYWTFEQEKQIWPLLAKVLETCPLLGQNAVHFDHYALALKHKILPNFVSDTMLGCWELYCEMPKSLGFINSMFDMQPFWKNILKEARTGKRHYTDEFKYCGMDTISTIRGSEGIRKELAELPKTSYEHYKFNIRLSRAFQYMSIHGFRFDTKLRDERVKELTDKTQDMQSRLHAMAGFALNVRSPKQVKEWLYDKLRLPVKYKTVTNDETGEREEKETADYLSMLKLAREFPDRPELELAGQLRKELKRLSTLKSIQTRPNGYVGYMLNVVGTETGRASSQKPLDGLGIQAQNQDRRDRDLYLPDEGYDICKADLEGADSWTVAAMCQAVGDPTMMKDLRAGIKPAQALAIAIMFGHELISAPVEQLLTYKGKLKAELARQKETRGPGRTDYDVTKAVSHGSNYMMGLQTTQDNMFRKSDGDLWVDLGEVSQINLLYFRRYYGLREVHKVITGMLSSNPVIIAQSGHRREFFGRKDNATVRQMMAHWPQANTGYATNKMIERLFYWEKNRVGLVRRNELLVQLLNQVHDETVTQWHKAYREQAIAIMKACTGNEFTCWGINFSIPFEMAYGENWGACTNEF